MSPVYNGSPVALRSLCLVIWLVCCIAAPPALPQADEQTAIRRLEKLTASLVAAKTEEERRALLEAEKDLVTVELEKALVRQGQRLSSQGSYGQALMIYNLAIQIAEQLGDKAGMAATLRNIGNVHNAQGSYTQALDYFQKSLELAEEIADKAAIARALGNIGIVYSSQGDYTLALAYYQKSLKLAEEVGDRIVIANTLNNIGVVHDLQADYTQASDYFQKSLKLREELGDKVGIATSLNNIGNVFDSQGNYAQALEYFQKSLKLAEEIGDKVGIARPLNNIGNVHNAQGNYIQALEYYRQSLKLREELGDKARSAATLGNIGVVYESQGDYAQALEYYRKSLKLAEEVGDKERFARALHNIGLIHYYQGNYTKALEYYRQSLKLREELGDKAGIARTLTNIGIVYESQANYRQAIELADRAAALAGRIGNLERLWAARALAGKAYSALNQPVLARRALDDAIFTIEKLRGQVAGNEQEQERFFENKLVPYYQMVALLVAQNNQPEALAYAERAKGRVLLDVLRSGRANITKAMSTEERARERQLNSELVSLNSQLYRENLQPQPSIARLSALNTRLQKARLEYESFQTSLYAMHPELKVQRGEAQPLSLIEAARLLPSDGKTALLEYAFTDDKSFLFVLTKRGSSSKQDTTAITLRVYPLDIKSKELSEMVETFKMRLGERNLAFSAHAERLYELLLKPAQMQLRGKETLCIVPDGVLWQLPFQALKPTASSYLIEEHAVFYAPSLTTLREMMKPARRSVQGRSPSSLLAFGNPLLNQQTVVRQQAVYRGEELGSLPEAEKEVNALRQLYGAVRSQVYTGAAAREERVKAEIGNYGVVHFATHGILDNRSPLYSHLLLAQAPGNSGEDGLLEAREIMEMDLKAELVVLSACQTAGGRVGAGEGVIGMTWALFVAGCPTTLVSQWKVDTRSTSKLMVEFHGNLQRQRQRSSVIRKAEALRLAMLTLLRSEEYELPYYWAPFVLVGNGF